MFRIECCVCLLLLYWGTKHISLKYERIKLPHDLFLINRSYRQWKIVMLFENNIYRGFKKQKIINSESESLICFDATQLWKIEIVRPIYRIIRLNCLKLLKKEMCDVKVFAVHVQKRLSFIYSVNSIDQCSNNIFM